MAMLTAASRPSIRIILLYSGVLSSAFLLHFCFPAIAEFVTYQLTFMYGAVASWLRPLYLYILINCIILSIFASSKLHHSVGSADGYAGRSVPLRKAVTVVVAPKEVGASLPYADYQRGHVYGEVEDLVVGDSVVVVTAQAEKKVALVEEGRVEETAVADVEFSDPTVEHKRSDSTQFTVIEDLKNKENHPEIVKQPFSARFDNRRSAKSSLEAGKSLRVSRTRQNDTLESTWRRITDSRATPPTRCVKKSETWRDTRARLGGNDENDPPPPSKMKKSETSNDNTSRNKELCGEISLGQDELNRRVEAFIKKFNEEMRLEREESLKQNQFRETMIISRGSG